MISNTKLNIVSIIFAVLFIVIATIFSVDGINVPAYEGLLGKQKSLAGKTKINPGGLNSAHEHMTMLIVVDGIMIDFTKGKYMTKDSYSHFEENNGIVIHKHAIGVTLPYFLSTLNINLTQNCITLDTGSQYCSSTSSEKKLEVIINGRKIENINTYELRHKDKILINYGDDNEVALKFKFNSIPNIPLGLI